MTDTVKRIQKVSFDGKGVFAEVVSCEDYIANLRINGCEIDNNISVSELPFDSLYINNSCFDEVDDYYTASNRMCNGMLVCELGRDYYLIVGDMEKKY